MPVFVVVQIFTSVGFMGNGTDKVSMCVVEPILYQLVICLVINELFDWIQFRGGGGGGGGRQELVVKGGSLCSSCINHFYLHHFNFSMICLERL